MSVEEIHSVGTINNVETSYFTQLKMCYLMTNVSMSVGHLDHVLIVYSLMEHVLDQVTCSIEWLARWLCG